MSELLSNSISDTIRAMQSTGAPDRRLHARKPFLSIAYVELGDGNGGVITNISEGGLAIQAALPLVEDYLPRIRFQLVPSRYRVEARGQVAWKSESKKTAGVRFTELSEEARVKIKECLSLEPASEPEKRNGSQKNAWLKKAQPSQKSEPAQSAVFSQKELAGREASSSVEASDRPVREEPGRPVSQIAAHLDQGAPLAAQPPSDVAELPDIAEIAGAEPAAAGRSAQTPRTVRQADAPRLARTRLKRFLVNERARIVMHDFVSAETEKVCDQLTEENFPLDAPVTGEALLQRLHRYEELAAVLIAIMSTGCFWGEKQQESEWAKLLERVANAASTSNSSSRWISLSSYPALLTLYAGGVAAVAKGKYSTLATLMLTPKFRDADVEAEAQVVQRLNAMTVVADEKLGRLLAGEVIDADRNDERLHASPVSSYLHAFLREPLREFVPLDADYDEAFDRFEYWFALIWTDENPKSASLDWVPVAAPLGRFASMRAPASGDELSFIERVGAEISQQKKDSPLLRAGLFGGSLQRLLSAKKRVDVSVAYLWFSRDSQGDRLSP